MALSTNLRSLFNCKRIVNFVLQRLISSPASNCASFVVIHRSISPRCCSKQYSSCFPLKLWGSHERCFEEVNQNNMMRENVSLAKLHTSASRGSSRSRGSDSDSDNDKTSSSCTHQSESAENFKNCNFNVDSLLETWFYEVCQYGSVSASIPFNTVIKPLNPQDYPDMNKVIIQLYYDSPTTNSDIPPSHQLSQISGLIDLNVTFDEDRANMNIVGDSVQGLDLPVSCILHVPLKFGENVKGVKWIIHT